MTDLQSLIRRKSATILGINTGTSIDGLDLSVVKIQQRSKQGKLRLRITPLTHRDVSFPAGLRDELVEMATKPKTTLEQLALLDEALGDFIGRASNNFIRHCQRKGVAVDCIASHGQTVRHLPEPVTVAGFSVNSTLQIGSPERIAAVANRLVVSHFRQADTALGGEGAPITTEAVLHCLKDSRHSRLIFNIGGIANFFYLPYDSVGKTSANTLAEDIGPGNLLLDQVTQALFNQPFDKAGAFAGIGEVNERLLKELFKDTFFVARGKSRACSTGREQYGHTAVKKILKRSNYLKVARHSVLTTLTELTARKIFERALPMLSADNRLQGIYLTGGGAKNTFLVQRLRSLFREVNGSWKTRSVSALGMNPNAFEATCYSVLGWMCLHGVPSIAHATPTNPRYSKRHSMKKPYHFTPILGRITQPPHTNTNAKNLA